MVLDSFSASYIGWPTSRFDNASEVQGERLRVGDLGREYAEPSSLELC